MHVMALRGGFVETAHPIRVVAFHDDTIGFQAGPVAHTTWRSAGKHLQAWASLEALGDPDLPSELLAIAVSSHSGEPRHIERVRALLDRFGVPASALRCGAEPPAHKPSHHALLCAGQSPSPLHNDCSGKHALMLAACAHNGWPLGTYLDRAHPLQQRVIAQVAAWTGESPGLATDGCGVPTFYLSVAGMARCWARMAAAVDDPQDAAAARMARIGQAAMAHPELTSGEGRIDLAIAGRVSEPYFGKIGARGVFCLALPERRLGLALKVLDGNEDALAVAVPAALEAAAPGCLQPDDDWPWATVRNVVGAKVGRRVVAGLIRV